MAIPQKVGLRRSNVAGKIPTSDQIELGELAFNTNDKKIYFKGDDGSVVDITSSLDNNEIEILNVQDGQVLQYNSIARRFENVTLTTDDVSETSNLYFTTQRAQNSISVSGDLSYSEGVISFSETYSTPLELKTAYESNADTNAFTDSQQTKVNALGNAGERDIYFSTSDPSNTVGNDGDIYFQYSTPV